MSIEETIRAAVYDAVRDSYRPQEAITIPTFDKALYNVQEAAEKLSLSQTTLYNLIHVEGFPVVRVGRKVLLPLEKIVPWLEEHGEGLLNA